MASESGSAVLELNDADREDTDAPSGTDDGHDGTPLIMEHGYDIAVKVDAPMKQLSTLETFVTYRVRCVCARWPAAHSVRRRYNHFKALHRRLVCSHPLLAVPPLPPLHSARQQLDRYAPAFVAHRTHALHAFLDRVAKHPILTHSEDLRIFLTAPDQDIDKVLKSESGALSLWGLSAALYGASENKHTNGARVKDPEFVCAAEYLHSLQHKLTALCALTDQLCGGSAALAHHLVAMQRVCETWSGGDGRGGGRDGRGGGERRAVAGVGAGAGAAGCALRRAVLPLRARATLPLLAQYARAHADKIRQRDAIHAAHVSSGDPELHNRLQQASEALRADLNDWRPKTARDLTHTLAEIADRQLTALTQVQSAWEQALRMTTETNVEELFKTVSKTAVQNLSPSRSLPLTSPPDPATDRDVEDIDNYSDCDTQDIPHSDITDDDKDVTKHEDNITIDDKNFAKYEDNITSDDKDITQHNITDDDINIAKHEDNTNDNKGITKHKDNITNDDINIAKHDDNITNDKNITNNESDITDSEINVTNKEINTNKDIDLSDILDGDDETLTKNSENGVSDASRGSKVGSNSNEGSKTEVMSDPLQSFSEVDLSS